MPKRQSSEQIKRYRKKLRKLEEEEQKKRKRIIYSSDSEGNSDNEEPTIAEPGRSDNDVVVPLEEIPPDIIDKDGDVVVPSDLDAEVLSALGETAEEMPKYGSKVHDSLPRIWQPILLKGLSKETKEKLSKEHLVPENCVLLKAPTLNPEISAAISETSRARDKRMENVQQQLGAGISAVIRGLDCLLEGEKRLEPIKILSDGCRLLCDLHFSEGEARKKCITPGLDKSFSNLIQDVPRDDMLFGSKLSEQIKASKLIEKQGSQIKKPPPAAKPVTPSPSQPSSSTSRPRSSGNWSVPPRFSSRGGRGGTKRSGTSSRGRFPAATAPSRSTYQPKQRAPNHQ